ncbi:MAG TPA: sigma-70 family RNA polymerase sigma factor [Micromonosporaceae bacterium]
MSAEAEFVAETEPYRRELLAHCYRMLGSVHDAEDLVQDVYLRAWRSYADFERRASVRTWLYRIATNACLNALQLHGRRRVLPSGLGAPSADPTVPADVGGPDVSWLEPMPDALVFPAAEALDPAVVVSERAGLRLALIASLQLLSGPQRAALILRDVLAFPAAEVAQILGTTTPAVKSSLQRARGRLREAAPSADEVTEPSEPEFRALVDQYAQAFETADTAALEKLLCQDATLEAPPFRSWVAGRATCVPFLREFVLGNPGDWRMLPTAANGRPALAAYYRSEGYGIVTFAVRPSGIAAVVSFGDPDLLPTFGFPNRL